MVRTLDLPPRGLVLDFWSLVKSLSSAY